MNRGNPSRRALPFKTVLQTQKNKRLSRQATEKKEKKMKKITIIPATIAVLALSLGIATGCDSGGHTHKYADDYTCHDRPCTEEGCDHVETATTEHVYGEWTVVTAATCTQDGEKTRTCVCGAVDTVKIPATGHAYADDYTCHDRPCANEGCDHVEAATTEHVYGEWTVVTAAACTQDGEKTRTCVCGAVDTATIPATGHAYADDYTCHDRPCANEGCDHVEAATTEHVYGEWTIIRKAECEVDGEKTRTCVCGATDTATIPATGHAYADNYTCHDRDCLNEGCDHVEAATTEHVYGEWTVVTAATCTQDGERKRTCEDCGYVDAQPYSVGHDFNGENVCTMCGKTAHELFLVGLEGVTVTVNTKKGEYVVSNGGGSAYAKIAGEVLTALKNAGMTSLTVTAINPAEGFADAEAKTKSLYVAADSIDNLSKQETAIAYYGWKAFWDAGKKVTFTLDLETYAGRDIYLLTNHVDAYPLSVVVNELVVFNPLDKSDWLLGTANGTVDYIEGKGWAIKSTNGELWYCTLQGKIMKYFIEQGYTKMTIVYANSFSGVDNPNVGAFVNTKSRILSVKADGSEDWTYNGLNGKFISGLTAGANGTYSHDVDLTDAGYNFTVDTRFVFEKNDNHGAAVTCAYIADIIFGQ